MSASVPRFDGLRPASETSSKIKQRTRATNTRAEVVLRKHLWKRGLRYRVHRSDLPGRPDIVFAGPKVVVFCDGDFWHGRDWGSRRAKLARGANADYWISKIESNMARDQGHAKHLRAAGWHVVRLWETDILKQPERAVDEVLAALGSGASS